MEFSKEVIEIFDYIGEKFGIAIDWSSENVVPYIKELCQKFINWEIATSAAWIAICVIIIVTYLCVLRLLKKPQNKDFYDFDCKALMFGIGLIVFGMSVVICTTQSFDIIKCICFPELKIYEYISSLAATK